MTVRTVVLGGTDWSDGEVLYAADLNDTLDITSKYGLFGGVLGTSVPRDTNVYNHLFTSDDAQTKTNFTYDATSDDYTVLGTSAGILVTADVNIDFPDYYSLDTNISKAFLKWRYYIFTVYDEFSDSSVNTSLWDTATTGDGTITEDTDKITLNAPGASQISDATLTSKDTVGDFYNTDDTAIFMWHVVNTTSSGAKTRLRITDDVTDVDLISYTTEAQNFTRKVILRFDSVNDKVHVWVNGSYLNSFDLSSLTKWKVEFYTYHPNAANTNTIDIYFFRVVDGTETTTITESFSSDGGTNYSTTQNGISVISTSSERGCIMNAKLTSTPSSGEGVSVNGVDFQGFTESD